MTTVWTRALSEDDVEAAEAWAYDQNEAACQSYIDKDSWLVTVSATFSNPKLAMMFKLTWG